jgi:hypothetical protein
MRGLVPSLGVAKLALSVPPPSCASARTGSLLLPPPTKLFCWKFPAGSVKPWTIELVVNHVVQKEQVLNGDLAIVLRRW